VHTPFQVVISGGFRPARLCYHQPMSWDGKVVWITGASSGIGEALAHAFARRGARLVLSARNEDRLREVQAACGHPERHIVLPLDLADEATLAPAVSAALARCGQVDVLVHNGGVSQRSLAKDTGISVDRRIFETNFFGAVTLTKALLPAMLARKSGRFVVISSLVGKFGSPLRSGYSASKHALHGFFDSLRAETWRDGIRITLVCPGFIRTAVSVNALTGDGSAQGTMDRAQQRGTAPEVCAERIVRAVERGKEEVLVGGPECLAVYVKRFAPGLFRRLIRRARVT
jgi:short-subunit dehydrogenase